MRASVVPELTPKLGELFLSDSLRSGSWTDTRVGEDGNASSTAFLGVRTRLRLGDPDGLWARIWGA